MRWVTVIWSMIASAGLTLGAIYGLVWHRNRTGWANLLFSATAASTAALTICELWLMHAQTPGEVFHALRWGHLAMLCWFVSMIWFVRLYLGAGRLWLAWTLTVIRVLYLVPSYWYGTTVNYREITSLRQVPFLGDTVTVITGVLNPWLPLGYVTTVAILLYVVDASVIAWRRGDRRKALMVGGSVEFFLILGMVENVLVFYAQIPMPIIISPLFLGMVTVMGYEVSHDVLRASQLVHKLQVSESELRESGARMAMAVDAADLGIWIRNLARHEVWASEKWRELFGFTPSEELDYDRIVARLHPDDRHLLGQAIAGAIAGADGFKYEIEYRVLLADGTTRWIASRGGIECDVTGQPVLMRGAVRDVTAAKQAESVVRRLSGRLLSAQEEERAVIARELHDNLSQQLALLSIEIEDLAMRSGNSGTLAASMRQLGARTAEISTEVHHLSHRLHSAKLDALGLQSAVEGHCRELQARGLQVECVTQDVPRSLPYEVALCLFRVVQEGLNNVVKHSGARHARVTLTGTNDGLSLTIADSGRGFNATAAIGGDGLGLVSMRERIHLIGGDLSVTSAPGHGATIAVRAPLAEAAADANAGLDATRGAYAASLRLPRSVADGDSPNTPL